MLPWQEEDRSLMHVAQSKKKKKKAKGEPRGTGWQWLPRDLNSSSTSSGHGLLFSCFSAKWLCFPSLQGTVSQFLYLKSFRVAVIQRGNYRGRYTLTSSWNEANPGEGDLRWPTCSQIFHSRTVPSTSYTETTPKSFTFPPQVTYLITHWNFHLPSSQLDLQANTENYENNFF